MRRLLVLPLLIGMATAVGAESPPKVHGVNVQADGPIDTVRVQRLLGLDAGSPLDRSRLRRGIRVLWADGRVDDVWVTSQPSKQGLDVAVRLFLRPRLESLTVTGPGWLWRQRTRNWLGLRPGQLFSQPDLERSLATVRRRLRDEGFSDARLDPALNYEPVRDTVHLTLAVTLGDPDLVAGVELSGIEDADGHLRKAAGLDPGDQLSTQALERARGRIERALRRDGHWEGEVLGVERVVTPAGLMVRFRVDPGPIWDLEVTGGKDLESLIRDLLPDPADGNLHPSQPGVVRDRLAVSLEGRGYLLARIDVSVREEDEQHRVLVVAAQPGARVKVDSVRFDGTDSLTRRRLLEAVRVHPGRVGGWRGQDVSSETLEQDRQAVKSLYRREGFIAAEVDPVRIEPLKNDRVKVVFSVHEGLKWRVADLRLEGFPVEVMGALEGPLPVVEEGPWNPETLTPARRALELALASAGYPDGSVSASVDTSHEGKAVVTLRAEPGPYVTLGEVVVTGLAKTAESVVRGVLEHHNVRTGEAYSLSAILDAQQELYALGLFRRVEVVPLPGEERGTRRGLLVRCEEGLQRSYVVGVGWDTESKARFILGWSHLNLFGHAHAVGAEVRLSSREKRYQANLRELDVLGLGVPGYLTAYRTEETFASFSQRRRGLWLDLGDRRRRPFRLWLRYEYQLVRPDAPPEILSQLEREDREIRIASLTPTIEWDTRDDPLDPSRGMLASLSPQVAFPLLRADAHFLKLEGRLALFGHLPGGTGALGLHLGLIEPLGVSGDVPRNLKVPLNARFFAGGRISHRAFAIDQLGIPGQTLDEHGDPIGGNALGILNLEYRRRLRGIVSWVVFLDAGNVWADPERVHLGDVRWGLGLGLRVHTPAGPLRLEYGHKLDREPGESAGRIFLSFGAAF